MDYTELKQVFQELKRTSPREDLTAHIIFTEDSFASPYPLLSRTYLVSSDNKGFCPGMFSNSVFAWCLDKNSDQGVRLDWYMADEGNANGWKVQDCYILERMRDTVAIPKAERMEQEDGTVCWFFGDTSIRSREAREDGKTRLEPVAGDQAACGQWTDLPMDRVYGYCTLLERHINQRGSDIMKKLTPTLLGWDSWSRPVYECDDGTIYVDDDPMAAGEAHPVLPGIRGERRLTMRRLTDQDIQDIIGSTIEGFRIEAARIKNGPFIDSDHYGFLLARNAHGCYVIWRFHLLEDESVSAYWGHYFQDDRDAAVRDFDTRDT